MGFFNAYKALSICNILVQKSSKYLEYLQSYGHFCTRGPEKYLLRKLMSKFPTTDLLLSQPILVRMSPFFKHNQYVPLWTISKNYKKIEGQTMRLIWNLFRTFKKQKPHNQRLALGRWKFPGLFFASGLGHIMSLNSSGRNCLMFWNRYSRLLWSRPAGGMGAAAARGKRLGSAQRVKLCSSSSTLVLKNTFPTDSLVKL